MKENKTWDYLPGTDIYLHQRRDMFRMNTDSALLGHFLQVKEGETVLDIGTNNGVLLLYASQYHPSYLYGVEIQKEACELARENLAYHKIDNAEIIEGDVNKISLPVVDVAICNPPYFKVSSEQQLNENQALRYARHEIYLGLETLAQVLSNSLKENGRCYIVHRAERIVDIVQMFRNYQLEIKKLQFVYDENVEQATAVLVEAVKNGKVKCTVMKPKLITRN